MSGLGRSREPKEVARLDFLLCGLGLAVFVEDDTSTFSGFDYVEPLVLVAMPVRDRADVVGRQLGEVYPGLGQAALVAEVQLVPEDTGV